jgi:hypothetical protein
VSRSDQATVDVSGTLHHLWQQNKVALRWEMRLGFNTHDINRAFALILNAADTTAEGETFTWTPSTAAQVQTDAAASGGSTLDLAGNSTASKTVVTAAASDSFVLHVRNTLCQGESNLAVTVDGTAVGTTTGSSSTYRDITYAGTWAAGSHTVQVVHQNDLWTSSTCDRNYFLDKVTFHATVDPAAPAVRHHDLRRELPVRVARRVPDQRASEPRVDRERPRGRAGRRRHPQGREVRRVQHGHRPDEQPAVAARVPAVLGPGRDVLPRPRRLLPVPRASRR